MTESLLSPSGILLYGRVMQDLKIDFTPPPDTRVDDVHPPGPQECRNLDTPQPPPRLGENKFLQRQLMDPDAVFARIYGFSYEGHYYDLPKPALFLVHGEGQDPEAWRPGVGVPDARSSRAPADADRTGVARTDSSFSEDMRVWAYDQGDFSIRMDVETGPFEQILLEAMLRPDKLQTYSGANVVGGANVFGGANVRGANVFGGANVWGRNRGGGSD